MKELQKTNFLTWKHLKYEFRAWKFLKIWVLQHRKDRYCVFDYRERSNVRTYQLNMNSFQE